MWPKFYRDYKVDATLKQYQVESGKGIVGCEMHDLNGWGTTVDSKEEHPETGFKENKAKDKKRP